MSTFFLEEDYERFLAKVDMTSDPNGCWLWTGARHSKSRGYGKFKMDGRTQNAHKVSYLLYRGEVEAGQVIGHQCNNERCVNPMHLKAESQADNMKYCVASGRWRGPGHRSNERQRTITELRNAA